mgnify:CR=1 FL=1
MIEIEGLPEGWKPLKVKISCNISNDVSVMQCAARVDLERIKPRRIVLEETEEVNATLPGLTYEPQWFGSICLVNLPKIWRLVEEE